MTQHDMRTLRLQLADCERALRTDREYFEQIKATIAKRGFDNGEITGKNAEERERNLIVYLATDDQYKLKSSELRHVEWQRDRTLALLEAAKDDRRAAEWQIRAKLADGLFRQQVQSDADDPAGDSAFDNTADYQAMRNFSGALNNLDDDSYVNAPSRAKPYETIPEDDLPW